MGSLWISPGVSNQSVRYSNTIEHQTPVWLGCVIEHKLMALKSGQLHAQNRTFDYGRSRNDGHYRTLTFSLIFGHFSITESHSLKVDNDYACAIYLSRNGFRTKSNWIAFNFVRLVSWFDNWTHSKIDVWFCSITELSLTIGVRLGSTGFNFVRLDTPGYRDKEKTINKL